MGEIRLPADKQPFVSVQLALYNEKRVVDRLLEACTSFDYENYEIIVVDDSADETVELLKRWQDHPRVRVIHRSSRKGFKGGALQEALRRTERRPPRGRAGLPVAHAQRFRELDHQGRARGVRGELRARARGTRAL